MSSQIRRAALAVLALLIGVSSAEAFWLRSWCCRPAPCYPAYSYPQGYGHGPGWVQPGIQVWPVPRAGGLARPTPAPPSANEPPLGSATKKAPVITEARSLGGKYVQGHEPIGDRLQVGFWNLSGREVRLKVNGQSHLVAKDKAVNLEVERTFVWQVDQGEPTAERVPDEHRRHEVLIRQ